MGNMFFSNLKTIKISQIERNLEQPRKYFDSEALEELAQSIAQCGVINPISVRKKGSIYQIVAGERRYRASKLAGLTEIPCIVLSSDDKKISVISIVENIQRYDLNFCEEALAYQRLIEDFGYKQEQIAKAVGKTQSSVANKLRILKLEPTLVKNVLEAGLTERHARALLKIEKEDREEVLSYIITKKLNVSQTDQFIEAYLEPKEDKPRKYFKLKADVRFFINSINKAVDTMKIAGIGAKVDKKHTDDGLVYTIVIPN